MQRRERHSRVLQEVQEALDIVKAVKDYRVRSVLSKEECMGIVAVSVTSHSSIYGPRESMGRLNGPEVLQQLDSWVQLNGDRPRN